MADKRLEDHDQALDAAVEEYRRIVKAKKFNTFQKSNHPSDYPPTTDKKFKFNNTPKAGDPLTFTTSSGKIIKWCRIHGWNNSHTLNECRKARSDDQTSKVAGMATRPVPSNRPPQATLEFPSINQCFSFLEDRVASDDTFNNFLLTFKNYLFSYLILQ